MTLLGITGTPLMMALSCLVSKDSGRLVWLLAHRTTLRSLGLEAAVVLPLTVTPGGCVGLRVTSATSFILAPAPWSRHCAHVTEGCRI